MLSRDTHARTLDIVMLVLVSVFTTYYFFLLLSLPPLLHPSFFLLIYESSLLHPSFSLLIYESSLLQPSFSLLIYDCDVWETFLAPEFDLKLSASSKSNLVSYSKLYAALKFKSDTARLCAV